MLKRGLEELPDPPGGRNLPCDCLLIAKETMVATSKMGKKDGEDE